jgi:hypothetical protein
MRNVLIVLIVLLAIGWIVISVFVKKKRGEGATQTMEELGGADAVQVLDDKAICRGSESGPFNAHVGMGALGLNSEVLLFQRWTPPDEVRIARSDLIEHTFVTEFQDKNYNKPILQIRYRNPEHTEGETPGEDVIAWEVQDQEAWNAALK